MGNLTVEQVEADVNYLMDSLDSNKRLIPSSSVLLKKVSLIPLLSVVLSFISTVVFYFSAEWNEKTITGYMHFLATEGWAVVVPTTIIGLFFVLLTYNKLLMYLTLPDDVRNKSIILQHLHKVTSRIISLFIFLMVCSGVLAAMSPWFCFAIPALLLVMMFAMGIVIGSEVSRLGSGMALEKISKLVKNI
ncbi:MULTISPECIES: hypothetical protein [unclassified Rahnella]|uniref:hypothetical protein n=1 Tax=unclassified Rahnella TaxID=2635087 RepID=UPI0010700305|nr:MULTISPECIES: hypothetical protein [unclassified Rahnella]MCM2447854.1 hypothetical protein [Rahnella sp. CG8]